MYLYFLSNLKVAIVGQRSDEALSLLYPQRSEAPPHTINLQRTVGYVYYASTKRDICTEVVCTL